MKRVCDHQCLACPYPDCICSDEPTADEKRESKERDREIILERSTSFSRSAAETEVSESVREKRKAYYLKHREAIKQRASQRYHKNREQMKADALKRYHKKKG